MRLFGEIHSWLKILGTLSAAFLSYLFYKVIKSCLRLLMYVYNRRHKDQTTVWRIFSADTLKMRIGLPIMMAMGPRWNTHAIVASAGPVRIKRSLGIRVDAAERSAKTRPTAATCSSRTDAPRATPSATAMPWGRTWRA